MMAEPAGMFNKLKAQARELQKGAARIERERAMLRPESIVLCHEFMQCFPKPKEKPSLYLVKITLNNAVNFTQKLEAAIAGVPDYKFSIPIENMTKESKAKLYDGQGSDPKYPLVEIFYSYFVREVYPGCFIKESPTMPPSMLATYVGVLVAAWEKTGQVDFFERAKYGSLVRGQGQAMTDFWKAVNGLHDYSHLFPETPENPRYRGGKPKEKNRIFLSSPWGELVFTRSSEI